MTQYTRTLNHFEYHLEDIDCENCLYLKKRNKKYKLNRNYKPQSVLRIEIQGWEFTVFFSWVCAWKNTWNLLSN